MDFYAVKFFATSSLTAEVIVGYMFGKQKGAPEYKMLSIPKSKLPKFEIPDINLSYIEYKSKIEELYYNAIKDSTVLDLNKQFLAFVQSTIKKYGPEIINAKMFLGVRDSDIIIVKAILSEILEEWEGEVNIKVVAEKLTYQDLVWLMTQNRSFTDKEKSYLNRIDVQNSPEVLPLSDPLTGLTINNLDVGDPIYSLVIDPIDPANVNKLKELYPDKFDDSGKNIMPIESQLVAKELIPETDYFFIKVDLGSGLIGKAVISKNLKMMVDAKKIEEMHKKREEYFNPPEDKIIGDVIKDSIAGLKKEANLPENKVRTSDILIILGLSLGLIVGALLLGIWMGVF
ncbi:hypothetical protein XO10_02610 [Marinitoga sp. 1135]|uniref:DUF4899 domain-containing protein n=1 Tax=Marinitoga piezophila (strain DSM 14283 / JCM 11233 / KA3) TaxID=443254 RepID=H2J593_MARPK|nr:MULTISPECIES: DUF4899 domain-containing protein [Marinitoga]AEX84951.1 hypothetical protein Marpi_0509 [Marinitoga piezophila KA3]APT75458.1 hypothetical protein LN42_02920 [Marinitoga sp. 1137]NUU95183.1 hypothetical protein [Marinitoga sp. 1135]NUU97115.1 hypothetical protein [Marinitoga sp. 1138]